MDMVYFAPVMHTLFVLIITAMLGTTAGVRGQQMENVQRVLPSRRALMSTDIFGPPAKSLTEYIAIGKSSLQEELEGILPTEKATVAESSPVRVGRARHHNRQQRRFVRRLSRTIASAS